MTLPPFTGQEGPRTDLHGERELVVVRLEEVGHLARRREIG